jgi:hypothetical protein
MLGCIVDKVAMGLLIVLAKAFPMISNQCPEYGSILHGLNQPGNLIIYKGQLCIIGLRVSNLILGRGIIGIVGIIKVNP